VASGCEPTAWPQPDIYRVFCIVVDEKNPFEVQIKKDETVSRLKDLIKQKKNDIFASIGSNLLDLYLVDLPSQKLSERMSNLQLDPSQYLEDVTMPLEEAFNVHQRLALFISSFGKTVSVRID